MIEIIKYAPFQSTAEPSFWMKLGDLKINKLKLSEDPLPISGSYGIVSNVRHRPSSTVPNDGANDAMSVSTMSSSVVTSATSKKVTSGRMRFDQDSVEHDEIIDEAQHEWSALNNDKIQARGNIILLNTIESFKTINKNKLLNEMCLPDLLSVCGIGQYNSDYWGEEEDERLDALTNFFCLAHLDLKSHKVIYWFAFPVLVPVPDKIVHYKTRGAGVFPPQRPLKECWGEDMVHQLQEALYYLRVDILKQNKPRVGHPSVFMVLLPTEKSKMQCLELSRHNYMSLTDKQRRDCCFAFLDPTSSQSSGSVEPVGWPLRNLIAYLVHKLNLAGMDVNIISYRPDVIRKIKSIYDPPSNEHFVEDSSMMLEVHLPSAHDYLWPSEKDDSSFHNCMGWELNARAKSGPRSVNLAPLMSPQHLAQQAMDLNLKLMKWRMIPNLDLNLLSQTRVLLLGAGTLGCSVARCLLGWGVRNITFVDNGKVSFSNPVRQNLFELDDCENGGAFKAVAAASALSRIAGQTVQSEGVVLSIPMPGHAFGAKEEPNIRADVEKLQELIDSSDVVFLLTDTRESRWLPTVMARSSGKLMINAALGLDSWLVMRHGGHKDDNRLGCYFCNDVVAPENSTNNRTLDQQCTVTRPGLAPIAASMAVELMVALLHHEDEQNAPAPPPATSTSTFAPTVDSSNESTSPLGIMPHQIRGSIVSYTMMTPTVPAFPYCTGCCESIVRTYDDQGFDFIKASCCNDGKYLEDVAGLTQFREEAAAKMEECDWEDDEDELY